MTRQTDEATIRSIIEGANDAHRARDANAIVAPYTPDAVLFDLAPPLARRLDAKQVAAWLDTWDGPVLRSVRDLDISVGGDLAFATFFVHTSAVTKNTNEQAEWWARATMCFERIEREWRVVHEHVSVPFYMDGSFRAALDLQP
jgi:ketosteroid isomerase-like protein